MKKRYVVLVAILGIFVDQARCQMAASIKLRQTYELPAEVKGNFDHFGIDVKGRRLFATPEGYHAVIVFDLKTGKLLHKIDGIGKPISVSENGRLWTSLNLDIFSDTYVGPEARGAVQKHLTKNGVEHRAPECKQKRCVHVIQLMLHKVRHNSKVPKSRASFNFLPVHSPC